MSLLAFVTRERAAMLRALTVTDLKRYMSTNPAEYIEPGTDTPSIDVRLCVDFRRHNRSGGDAGPDDTGSWIIRTGSVDFDPYHSEYCSASSVQPDTDTESLLDDLISGLEES